MDINGAESNTSHSEIEEILDEVDTRFKQLNKFDVVSDPPFDHHFLHPKNAALFGTTTNSSSSSSSFTEKLQQEWKTLESNLPDSILVKAYDNRIDLMRAVIIGPPNTPYYHGIFFFDILFPSNYPNRPPKIFYHSQGFDLNPNLRPHGKVCLPLLETWYGRLIHGWYGCKAEKWDPNKSNLLQVLVSIQTLVLNSKPYLNEPVRLYVFYEWEVLKYNRNAFVLTCEAIIRTLDSPPRNFEEFVAGYFRERAHAILMNYRGYMDQSEGMVRLFHKLLRALEANGAYCKHHLSQVNIEKPTSSANNGMVNRLLFKLKTLGELLA